MTEGAGGLRADVARAWRAVDDAQSVMLKMAWTSADVVAGRVLELDGDRFRLRLDDVPAGARVDSPGWVTLDVDGWPYDVSAYVAAVEDVLELGAGRVEVAGALVAYDGPRPADGSPDYLATCRLHRRFLGLMRGRRLTQWALLAGELRPVHESLGVDVVGGGV